MWTNSLQHVHQVAIPSTGLSRSLTAGAKCQRGICKHPRNPTHSNHLHSCHVGTVQTWVLINLRLATRTSTFFLLHGQFPRFSEKLLWRFPKTNVMNSSVKVWSEYLQPSANAYIWKLGSSRNEDHTVCFPVPTWRPCETRKVQGFLLVNWSQVTICTSGLRENRWSRAEKSNKHAFKVTKIHLCILRADQELV